MTRRYYGSRSPPLEFSLRALGSRSILGDARNPDMHRSINKKVKFREGLRPFAPIVLAGQAHEYFKLEPGQESPYLLLVAPVREAKRSVIPAVTHVDHSARVQTVDPRRHGLLRRLLERFYVQTGCPVLINTSLNLGRDPIVCTPQGACDTFMACGLDILVMGHCVLRKTAQPATTSGHRTMLIHPLNVTTKQSQNLRYPIIYTHT